MLCKKMHIYVNYWCSLSNECIAWAISLLYVTSPLKIMKREMYVNTPLSFPRIWMCAAGKAGVT